MGEGAVNGHMETFQSGRAAFAECECPGKKRSKTGGTGEAGKGNPKHVANFDGFVEGFMARAGADLHGSDKLAGDAFLRGESIHR